MTTTEAEEKKIWHLYLLLGAGIGFICGIDGSFSLLYLNSLLEGLHSSVRGFDLVLVIFAFGTGLEFFADPLTGHFADESGRKKSMIYSFVLNVFSALVFFFISPLRLNSCALTLITAAGMLATFLFTVGITFYSGALDAWFVDELTALKKSEPIDFHDRFVRQSQVLGGCMVLGGTIALLADKILMSRFSQRDAAFFTANSWVWLINVLVSSVMIWVVILRMHETSFKPGSHSSASVSRGFIKKITQILSTPILSRVLVVGSVMYAIALSYSYLSPLLYTSDRLVESGDAFSRWIACNFWVFYFLIGFTRILGPWLTKLGRGSKNHSHSFRKWTVLNSLSVLFAGACFLFCPGQYYWVGVVFLYVSKLTTEALKPVQSAYVNQLISDSSMRALTLSMVNPGGALVIFLTCLGLILRSTAGGAVVSSHHSFESTALFFAAAGVLGLIVTLVLNTKSQNLNHVNLHE